MNFVIVMVSGIVVMVLNCGEVSINDVLIVEFECCYFGVCLVFEYG